jgi:hypothetical protein
LKDLLLNYLSPKHLHNIGIDNSSLAQQLLNEHLQGKKNHYNILWALFVLSRWHEEQKRIEPSRAEAIQPF